MAKRSYENEGMSLCLEIHESNKTEVLTKSPTYLRYYSKKNQEVTDWFQFTSSQLARSSGATLPPPLDFITCKVGGGGLTLSCLMLGEKSSELKHK